MLCAYLLYKGILLRIDDGIEKRKAVEGVRVSLQLLAGDGVGDVCWVASAGWRLLGADRADCWEIRRDRTMGRSVGHASTVAEAPSLRREGKSETRSSTVA